MFDQSTQANVAVAWHLLEITGITQAVLCALFGEPPYLHTSLLQILQQLASIRYYAHRRGRLGIYFSLFVLALWANHGRHDFLSRLLRVFSIVL